MTVAPQQRGFFAFDNSYARLPERFFAKLPPTPVAKPALIRINARVARLLGLDPERLATPEGIEILAGNRIAEGSEPIAQAYAGHQFGGFSPQLGDGRAILLGEIVGPDGVRRDVQLKGSGPTPFSRRGDGRAALGPVLREYIVSEGMAGLGIPTTLSLAAVTTGEKVFREQPLPGAVLTRIAASHIRVGTFQFFAARGDMEGVKQLADYTIARHYPEIAGADNPYRAFLDGVVARQADLIARWMLVGFIHGVMNTDNMSIAGETIDYGPCAFMDAYHPGKVFSSIDQGGRYAFANQPAIAQWNLARLAETLLPLLAEGEDAAIASAQESLSAFKGRFEAGFAGGLARKIGLEAARGPDDFRRALDLLDIMTRGEADFTLTFRRLSDAAAGGEGEASLRALFSDAGELDAWLLRWRARLAEEVGLGSARRAAMQQVNPLFIPRNHRVEEAIRAALMGDQKPFDTLVEVLQRPFDDRPEHAAYAAPPEPEEIVRATFCGT